MPALYTAGYEGKSVDTFFNVLIKEGIRHIVDVRADPVSRRRGFSKRQFSEIAETHGISYVHMRDLGVPKELRRNLTDDASHQRLLDRYEREILPEQEEVLDRLVELVKTTSAVLVCMEKDVQRCHRSRLANAVSLRSGLEIRNL